MRYEVTVFGKITRVVYACDEDEAFDKVVNNIDEGDFYVDYADTKITEVEE